MNRMSVQQAAHLPRLMTGRIKVIEKGILRYLPGLDKVRDVERVDDRLTDAFCERIHEGGRCLITKEGQHAYFLYVQPANEKAFCVSFIFDEELAFFDHVSQTVPWETRKTPRNHEQHVFITRCIEEARSLLLDEKPFRLPFLTGMIRVREILKP